jgi:hypothetical protein
VIGQHIDVVEFFNQMAPGDSTACFTPKGRGLPRTGSVRDDKRVFSVGFEGEQEKAKDLGYGIR